MPKVTPLLSLPFALLLALLACGVLGACSSTADGPAAGGTEVLSDLPPEANRMQADHAPTPFSAAQIQAACTEGAWREYVFTQGPITQRFRMVFGPELDGRVEVTTIVVDAEGQELASSAGQPTTWAELQAHASFPQSLTTIAADLTEVPAGSFATWTYSTKDNSGGEQVFSFARDLPGSPVLMTTWVANTMQSRMELVGYGTD
ncbi:MAG: hypothetical protein P1V81_09400 [Planctomycetota bacterium]|nr:hypothetical protein [Planctomycetota bacterium]